MTHKILTVLWRYSPLLLLAAVWEAVTQAHLVSQYALPTLSGVLHSLWTLAGDDLTYHTSRSIMRGAAGLGAAVVPGPSVGGLTAWSRPVRLLLKPFIQMFYPLPKSALIPITIMWIGLGDPSKITLIFIGSLLPVVVSSFNAARGVDTVLLWSARGMGATEREILWEVVVPAALPEILNGYRVALALCFILVVAGELIIANNGIGFLINFLGEGGDYKGMFAGVITISLVGFLADRGYLMLMRRILIWRE
jgi:ABC-type nitrate/sulfonate/bicarbonate transport system permease component